MDSSNNPPTGDFRLHIRMLGGLCVYAPNGEANHEAVSLRRPAAVLVAAAVARDRGISRDKILGLLWPDTDPSRARHSLTQAMYAVRKATGVDDLFLTRGALRLNPARASTDIEEFEQALADGDLERAVSLHEGPFLDGFFVADSAEFEQWVSAQRGRFEDRAAAALDRLAGRATGAGDFRGAVEWHRRLAAMRPLDATAAANLIAALAAAGDRAGAIEHAHDHAALLKEQLDIEPDPAFAKMVESLRDPLVSGIQADLQRSIAIAPMSDESGQLVVAASQPETAKTLATAPSAGLAPTRPRIRRQSTWIAAAAAAVVFSAVAWRGFADRRAPTSSVAAVASVAAPAELVAPFNTSGASASLDYLGLAMARLVTNQLAADSSQRMIQASAVAAAWGRAGFDKRRNVERDSIRRFAATQGAGRLVIGSVVGDRARTVVSASVLSVSGDSVLASGTVEGSADSLSRLANDLVAKLLISEAREDSTLGAVQDTPLSALRAFLLGRSEYRRGRYIAAADAFQTALRSDSTFALAAMELARVSDRIGNLDELDAALAVAWRYRSALDNLSRSRLTALAGPAYPRASAQAVELAAWGGVVQAAPKRAASWYELGAQLAHEGKRLGAEDANAQAVLALNHALLLDPRYTPASDLLIQLALKAGERTNLAVRVSTGDSSAFAPFLKWRALVGRGDLTSLRRDRASIVLMNSENLREIAMASQFDAVGLDDGALAIQTLAARATTTSERVDAVLAAHSLALNTGRSADALAQTRVLQRLRPDSHAYLRLRVLDALYGGGDSVAATNAAAELGAPVDSLFRDFPLARSRVAADGCVLAQWRLSHGDTTRVHSIITLLRAADIVRDGQPVAAAPSVCGDLIEASLAVVTRQADALARVQHVDGLVLTSAVAGNASLYANVAISRMYSALGYPRLALAALGKRTYMAGWPTYLATAWRDESRLAAAIGEPGRGARSTHQYTAIRTVAVAATRPLR